MGNKQSTKTDLSRKEVDKWSKESGFGEKQLKELWAFFRDNKEVVGKKKEGLRLETMRDLMAAMGWNDTTYMDRIFQQLDDDDNGYVDFSEFVIGLALLFKGDIEQKLEFFFDVFDLDGNGTLTIDEIEHLVRANIKSLQLCATLTPDDEEKSIREWSCRFYSAAGIAETGELTRAQFKASIHSDKELLTFVKLCLEPGS